MPERVRVLIADDDVAMRELMVSVLQKRGMQVEAAGDGEELLRHLNDVNGHGRAADVIVSDVQMPNVSGLDLLHWVQRRCEEKMPVILITAFGDARLHRRARELGAVDVIDKPFDLMQLGERIEQVAREHPR